MRVNKPFSYQEIQRIKEDLGDYLEDPEKYIRAFKGVTLLYDLTWKDVMYILGQTLTPESKTRVLGMMGGNQTEMGGQLGYSLRLTLQGALKFDWHPPCTCLTLKPESLFSTHVTES